SKQQNEKSQLEIKKRKAFKKILQQRCNFRERQETDDSFDVRSKKEQKNHPPRRSDDHHPGCVFHQTERVLSSGRYFHKEQCQAEKRDEHEGIQDPFYNNSCYR